MADTDQTSEPAAAVAVEIKNIEDELAELETLIKLQRRKVELLGKKNDAINSTADSPNNSPRPSAGVAGDSVEMAPKSILKSNNPMIKEPVQKGMHRASSSSRFSDFFKGMTKSNAADANAVMESIRQTVAMEQEQQAAMVTSIQRMSRLTTDLANERNLLAWGRTALAAARTSLAFLGVAATSLFGEVMAQFVTISFIVMASAMMVHAIMRYKRIKNILMQPEPPLHFDRLSNVPLQYILILLFILALAAIASQSWDN